MRIGRVVKCLVVSAAAMLGLTAIAFAQTPAQPKTQPPTPEIDIWASAGDLEKVRALLKADPNLVFTKDDHGATPLFYAVSSGADKELVEFLLANHADVNAKDNMGFTPLHTAALRGHRDLVEVLLTNHADVNAKNTDGETPLHAAAEGGNKGVAEVLLTHHAEVNAKDRFGETPLHIAAHTAHKEVAEVLLANHADVNAKDNKGYTPLHATTEWGGGPYIKVESIVELDNTAALLRRYGGQ